MNKLKSVVLRLALTMCVIFSSSLFAMADVINAESYKYVSRDQIEERISDLNSNVDARYTTEIHSIINNYIRRYRKSSEILLGRVDRYFPYYELELQKQGLPSEIKYLSVVESHLKPRAVSVVGAVGLWQFMRGTGKEYGLTINRTVDERRDHVKSTAAAAAFLTDLYEEFGDWTLAMAAYNCGAGGVRKAKRRSGGETFWEIKPYLPKETRRYIPKFIAISYFMNYFHLHGLSPNKKGEDKQLASARIYDYMTFKQISQKTGVPVSLIRELNPAFLKGYIPKNGKGYHLTLPEQEMYSLLGQINGFNDLVYNSSSTSQLKGRFYMYGSMRNRVIEMGNLDALPTLQVRHSLRVGITKPKLPTLPSEPVQTDRISTATAANNRYVTYKLMAQQSLSDVAEMFDMRLEQLVKLNNFDITNPPAPGTLVKIDSPSDQAAIIIAD